IGTGLEVSTQGGVGQRGRLISRLKRSKGAILLGTASMWEGIDLPGKALEIVVIPRLPFSVPDDPIVAARIDHIRDEGGNPFYEFQVPTAALRLRQGTVRLIRSTTDRGIILILDPRVISKGYGKDFRGAVHGKPKVVDNTDELEQCVKEFFDGADI
ncbi:MAG: helicase C-terminal domain-containing protein, partial [Candidatus Electryoneaceae bacterium]|nr:helicase C-terminal domain-containing protein [Candidatus Electryoneaceae bacterium]